MKDFLFCLFGCIDFGISAKKAEPFLLKKSQKEKHFDKKHLVVQFKPKTPYLFIVLCVFGSVLKSVCVFLCLAFVLRSVFLVVVS